MPKSLSFHLGLCVAKLSYLPADFQPTGGTSNTMSCSPLGSFELFMSPRQSFAELLNFCTLAAAQIRPATDPGYQIAG